MWFELTDGLVLANALLLAYAIDHLFGEPPARLHPVVWMGKFLDWTKGLLPVPSAPPETEQDVASFMAGASIWIAVSAIIFIAAYGLQWMILQLSTWWATLLLGVLLKPLFAWRMLRTEVQAVESALVTSIEAGRAQLSRLVSRDTTALTAVQVRESAIETLAENLNDSLIAPIFWYVLLGLPGAAVYRFANTADAMWGYKGIYKGRNWEWAGKWAARADDVLSWLPARITAAILWCAAGFKTAAFWTRLRQETRKTPSPNSGWPMAAMALLLNVLLAKPNSYCLNQAGRQCAADDNGKALNLASKSAIFSVFIAYIAIIIIAFGVPE